jgi:hypothetical protein
MGIRSCIFVFLAVLFIGCGSNRVTEDLIGKTITLEYGIAGNELSVTRIGNEYRGVRRILGSGVPVIQELTYSIRIIDGNTIEFDGLLTELSVDNEGRNAPDERIRIVYDRNRNIKVVINGEERKILGIR